ncbi:MAG: ankyrin repeat domain-containing protein [Gammaproteobacteria bacterium]|nr:ankyrin repeat domain-containing protein [Gammaproteobacteria bacterium]
MKDLRNTRNGTNPEEKQMTKPCRQSDMSVWKLPAHVYTALLASLMLVVAVNTMGDQIHDAVKANDLERVERLMAIAEERRGEPGLKDLLNRREGRVDRGMTPVQLAAMDGRAAMIRLLTETGVVDVDAVVILPQPWGVKGTALNLAVIGCYVGAIKALLQAGADPNGNSVFPPVVQALGDGHVECVMALLEGGTNVDLMVRAGRRELSVLDIARRRLDYFIDRYTGSNRQENIDKYRGIVSAMEEQR